MEPIPETVEALNELDPSLDDTMILNHLLRSSHVASQVAPGLVGVSLASREHGYTFTVVATSVEIAALDAVQYLAGGPCVEAIDRGHGIATPEGLLNEARWQDFAHASAAAGIRSTLTLPVVSRGEVVSTINLYGRADTTFSGKHAALADVFGAWAPGTITNADLSFSTRAAAQRMPGDLRDIATVDTATGILAAERNVAVDEARAQLDDAARRAGVPVVNLAHIVIDLRPHW